MAKPVFSSSIWPMRWTTRETVPTCASSSAPEDGTGPTGNGPSTVTSRAAAPPITVGCVATWKPSACPFCKPAGSLRFCAALASTAHPRSPRSLDHLPGRLAGSAEGAGAHGVALPRIPTDRAAPPGAESPSARSRSKSSSVAIVCAAITFALHLPLVDALLQARRRCRWLENRPTRTAGLG